MHLGYVLTNFTQSTTQEQTTTNPKNFLRNARQQFPCQNLESLSEEYYNMENKILNFQFKPVCTKQACPNSVLEVTKMKQKSSKADGVHKNGPTVKYVKRCQPVKNACAVTKFWQLRHFI